MIGKKKEPEVQLPELSDAEFLEFEAYFRKHDNEAGPHRAELALAACNGLLMLEMIRLLKKK